MICIRPKACQCSHGCKTLLTPKYSMISLSDLIPHLDSRLEEALQKMGTSSIFLVQLATSHEMIGPGSFVRDICVNSPIGSGKTLDYALSIVEILSTRKIRCLRALVVLSTRDLALLVKEVFDAIASAVGLSVGLAAGQFSIADEVSKLIVLPNLEMTSVFNPENQQAKLQSSVNILVAALGRPMDHISTTKCFSLEHLCYLVVDETDKLLMDAYESWLPSVIQLACLNNLALFGESAIFSSMLSSLTAVGQVGRERGLKDKSYPRLVKMILSTTPTQDPSKLSQLGQHHPLSLTSGDRRYKLPKKLQLYKLICESKLKPLYLIVLLQNLREKSIVFTSSVK